MNGWQATTRPLARSLKPNPRIKWNAPEYQDDSFSTTGETEEVEEEEEETMKVIQYKCPKCQHEWEERWTSACDSECPECGTTDIQAMDWEEADDNDGTN